MASTIGDIVHDDRGGAFTRLPGGVVERYHFPLLDTCTETRCQRRHATKVELNTFATDDAARDFAAGKDAGKGERS